MRVRAVLSSVMVLLAAGAAGQAQPAAPPGPPAEMKQLDFLVGSWKGAGMLHGVMGPEPVSFESRLTVRKAVGGTYLVLEDVITATVPGMPEPMVVHESIAIVHYDAEAKVFRCQAFFPGGQLVDWTATYTDGKYIETISPSPFSMTGTARFTNKSTGANSWEVLGEQTDEDGGAWTKVLETKYTRASGQ